MRIYLIRHGETDWNVSLRLQGREDIPLNECGKRQAYVCGETMKRLKVDRIVSSPLMRAKDTAKIIGERMGIDHITIDEDITERDFGEASGITYQEKCKRYKDREIPGIEKKEVLRKRMIQAVLKYRTLNRDILMVSHGGCINALIDEVAKGTFETGKTRLKNTAVSVLEINKNSIKVIEYNLDAKDFAKKYLNSEI